jgi:hypothetical protein
MASWPLVALVDSASAVQAIRGSLYADIDSGMVCCAQDRTP